MQRLTAAPRDGLTEQQVFGLLHADALQVSAGCELLASDLTVVADISDDLVDGSIERNMNATIHATCKLDLTRAAVWGSQLARPYMLLTDVLRGVTARFNTGAYVLVTPEDVVGSEPRTYSVQGYDRVYLLDRPVGDSYTVPAGTEYLAAVRTAFTAAGLTGVLLDGTATGKTLPIAMSWPLVNIETGTDGKKDQSSVSTWLRVINDLLAAIGYRGVWADENGVYRSEPYQQPSVRGVEWTLDADSRATLVGADRTRIADQWKRNNRWVFIQRNLAGDPPPAPVEGAGIYTVTEPTSGLVWTRVEEMDAADQAALIVQGDAIVAADRRRTETLKVTTAPLPIAGHYDVLTYADVALGGARKVQAIRWSLPLGGGDMTWDLEVVA